MDVICWELLLYLYLSGHLSRLCFHLLSLEKRVNKSFFSSAVDVVSSPLALQERAESVLHSDLIWHTRNKKTKTSHTLPGCNLFPINSFVCPEGQPDAAGSSEDVSVECFSRVFSA